MSWSGFSKVYRVFEPQQVLSWPRLGCERKRMNVRKESARLLAIKKGAEALAVEVRQVQPQNSQGPGHPNSSWKPSQPEDFFALITSI